MPSMSNIKNFISNARHILYVSYKPNEQRFKRTANIIILGIVLIGVIGFIIAIIISLLVAGNFSLI